MINNLSFIKRLLLFTFVSLTFSLYARDKIEIQKVEPPFWWTGMQENHLQLLVYGNNIAETRPQINYEGVKLIKSTQVENPNYLFLDLKIDKNCNPGTFEINFLQKEKIAARYTYELKQRKPHSAERKGFSNKDVIYLLMPDRFANGDPENDSQEEMLENANRSNPDGRHGGDLQGIQKQIPYLKDLGITALWLNPVLENNQKVYSYHGYAISNFYEVDKRMGSNQDYVSLIEEMHKNDLKMIMDMVFNHCGINHWWMNDLPMKDWLHQFPEFTRSNYRSETLLDPHASDYDSKKMIAGWFDRNMPDLNQRNEFVANYLIQNSIWWIEYAGLDGIRMDTYPYSYKEFMARWMQRIEKEYPNFTVVGESWLQSIPMVSYWQDNSYYSDKYDSDLQSVFDFPMYYAIGDAFTQDNGWSTGAARLYETIAHDYLYGNTDNLVVFADNHDLDRFYTSINEDFNSFKMAMAFVMTTRGIPLIYYGTEILMTGIKSEGHGKIREDFPGGWPDDQRNAFTSKGRTELENKAFDYLSKLIHWRQATEAVQTGKLKHFIPENGVYVYFRYNKDHCVMVILNNSDEIQSLETGRFKECMKHYSSGKEIISGKEISDLSSIRIEAKTPFIIELKR